MALTIAPNADGPIFKPEFGWIKIMLSPWFCIVQVTSENINIINKPLYTEIIEKNRWT